MALLGERRQYRLHATALEVLSRLTSACSPRRSFGTEEKQEFEGEADGDSFFARPAPESRQLFPNLHISLRPQPDHLEVMLETVPSLRLVLRGLAFIAACGVVLWGVGDWRLQLGGGAVLGLVLASAYAHVRKRNEAAISFVEGVLEDIPRG